jgi:hypothetical protein
VTTFHFDILFEPAENYSGPTVDDDQFFDMFYVGGCDDALISSQNNGRRLQASFSRKGKTVVDAVLSALHDINKIMPKFQLISIQVDYSH